MKKYLFLLLILVFAPIMSLAVEESFIPINELNTPYIEFSPTLSPDGKTLVFSSDRPGGLGDQDLWMSKLTNGHWSKPVDMVVLNSMYHDQQPCFSHDGRAILFSSDRDGGAGAGDIYISVMTPSGAWSKPINLGAPINTADSEKMPSLSMDNTELYFCRSPIDYSVRKVDDSKIKIMRSFLKEDDWSEPEALPAPVNVGARDEAPRILADDRTLIFASTREGGKGGLDIWRVQRKDRNSPWADPVNLTDVNTEADDAYFSFDITGKNLIVASGRNQGMRYDLFQMGIAKSVMTPAVTLQGRVTNMKTGEPLDADMVVEVFGSNTARFAVRSDNNTGRFSVTLPGGADYSFTVEKKGFLFSSRRMDQKDLRSTTVTNIDFGLKPIETGEILVIPTIYFEPDSDVIKPDSFPALERVWDILHTNPWIRFLITGHVADTPGIGSDPVALSQKRADAVKSYLVEKGCNAGRLETKGMGIRKNIGDNSTEAGREQNRRTEFEVIK